MSTPTYATWAGRRRSAAATRDTGSWERLVDNRRLARATAREGVIVFDIGGTWFRSGVVRDDGCLVDVDRVPAISYVRYPDTPVHVLQDRLVNYLCTEVERLRATSHHKVRMASISMGAALNARTGWIYNDGPLWGPGSLPLDLGGRLAAERPDIEWNVVNDVTAALLHHVARHAGEDISRMTLVTVSTGIAARTFDWFTNSVPVDREYGMQGEIGHLPVRFLFRHSPVELRCDCGGLNHLNAFSSGRGIEQLIQTIAMRFPHDFAKSHLARADNRVQPDFGDFVEALKHDDALAVEILDAATQPLADVVRVTGIIDPHVERIVFTGGVVHTLGERYADSLHRCLDQDGIYQISDLDPGYFRRRLSFAEAGEHEGLRGAALACDAGPALHLPGTTGAGMPSVVERPAEDGARWQVSAHMAVRYEVVETEDAFGPVLDRYLRTDRALVIMDAVVGSIYEDRVRERLGAATLVRLPSGERLKNMTSVVRVLDAFDSFGVGRQADPVVAVGGGTLLDVVGLAAGLYRRGIRYLRVPTTLLAMVDAGIGAKVGVNLDGVKSRIGSYHPSVATLVDTSFLQTLDERSIRNGVAEIVKMAVVCDRALFDMLESSSDLVDARFRSEQGGRIMGRAIGGMLSELAPNLWEHDLSRRVDFGHTFSPGIEMRALPQLLHGEAVAIDIALSSAISTALGVLPRDDLTRILSLLRRFRLQLLHDVCDPDLLHSSLNDVRLHRGGSLRMPLPVAIGRVQFVDEVSRSTIGEAVDMLRGWTA